MTYRPRMAPIPTAPACTLRRPHPAYTRAPMDAPALERLADLIVSFGANVQPGQIVAVATELGKEALTRAVAESAYRHGAKFVDVASFDPHVKRARLLHAPGETLDFVPPWYGERALALGELRAARIALAGPVAPHLFDDLDPARSGRDQLPWVPENGKVINERKVNWTVAPCPTSAWAQLIHADLEPDDATATLYRQILHICRLDEDDPVAAWKQRTDELVNAAARLTERRFTALHFTGPGTELRVGLLPSSRWLSAVAETLEGIPHMANLPSEEIFTTPDPVQVDGTVRSTRPLVLGAGPIVRGLRVSFQGGRAVAIDADAGAGAVRALCARDEGAARLGEVALVDGGGRIGPLGTVFYDTLLDENASSHIAFGLGYAAALDDAADRARANTSEIHVDFMIGGEGVEVAGETATGELVPVLIDGGWAIP